METLIFGAGRLGRAIEAALVERGDRPPILIGRPSPAGHRSTDLASVDVVFEASRSDAVRPNLMAALDAGNRRFVIATTGWEAERVAVEGLLIEHRASAVAAPNLSLGVTLFGRLVGEATALFGALDDVDPYLLEWHRRSKLDRPSGTALELAHRILATHPRKRRVAMPGSAAPPAPDELEVAVIRAGASPGMHLVGFDAPGETIELRLTARDRSSYAAGAVAAADWLAGEPRVPGLHPIDAVVDELLAGPTRRPTLVPS